MGVVKPGTSQRSNCIFRWVIGLSFVLLISKVTLSTWPVGQLLVDTFARLKKTTTITRKVEQEGVDNKTKADRLARKSYFANRKDKENSALSLIKKALELDPTNIQAHWRKASMHVSEEEFEDAFQTLNIVFQLSPDEPPALRIRAGLYRLLGKFDLALADLNKAISLQPDFPWVYKYRAELYRDMYKLPKALQDVDEYLRRRPNDESGLWIRAVVLQRLGRFEDALAMIDKAMSVGGSQKYYRGVRRRISRLKGGRGTKLDELSAAVDANPQNMEALLKRAKFFKWNYAYRRGLADVNALLRVKPESFEALKLRVWFLRGLRRYRDALNENNRVIAAKPKEARHHLTQAKILRRLRRYREALLSVRKARNIKSTRNARELQERLQHEFSLHPQG